MSKYWEALERKKRKRARHGDTEPIERHWARKEASAGCRGPQRRVPLPKPISTTDGSSVLDVLLQDRRSGR